MDTAAFTAELKAEARRLGFPAARAALAQPAAHRSAFRAWLDAGMHGEMAYMARVPEVREDPAALLPGAVSALVVGLNYFTPDRDSSAPRPAGVVSRYVRGGDYHEAMWARLNELGAWVRARVPGAEAKGCVDTAPVLERDLAAAGGLGWIGKNTCLITPGVGSWYFIGELLLSVPLEPDPPIGDHCGSCRRCLDACPTGAFAGPRALDARRCISYLTIELKGPIPRDLRPLMGLHVYGCDICQDVCPHNKWQTPTNDPALQPRSDLNRPDLLDLLSLDAEAFRARFRGSAILRTKRRGLLRNVCVALGNAGDARAAPALTAALSDPEPLVRGHAAWALGRLGGAEEALRAARAGEADAWVREEIDEALSDSLPHPPCEGPQ
ncbi:MAG TPA: tRNA epoxyqueuosine(34) reductase QueG [Armatimonadota bacterium]|jgi:epoxyqueuosine reductase